MEAQPGADGIGDPFYPQQGNGGYDVTHYSLNFVVDVEQNIISGTAAISARTVQPLSAFNLDFGGPAISQARIDGQPVEVKRRNVELTFTPTHPLDQGQLFLVEVDYRGEPGAGMEGRMRGFSNGWNNYGEGIFVANEPSSAVGWFPVNEHPLDKASYSIRVTVPKPFTVAANGTLLASTDNGDSTTYHWRWAALWPATWLRSISLNLSLRQNKGQTAYEFETTSRKMYRRKQEKPSAAKMK